MCGRRPGGCRFVEYDKFLSGCKAILEIKMTRWQSMTLEKYAHALQVKLLVALWCLCQMVYWPFSMSLFPAIKHEQYTVPCENNLLSALIRKLATEDLFHFANWAYKNVWKYNSRIQWGLSLAHHPLSLSGHRMRHQGRLGFCCGRYLVTPCVILCCCRCGSRSNAGCNRDGRLSPKFTVTKSFQVRNSYKCNFI